MGRGPDSIDRSANWTDRCALKHLLTLTALHGNPDCPLELLHATFDEFDRNNDGVLCAAEIEELIIMMYHASVQVCPSLRLGRRGNMWL